MVGSVVVVTPPAIEPLTLDEVEKHLRLGAENLDQEPAPGAASVALAGAGAGNVDNGAHRYRVTFVTADGETEGGTISETVTVADKTVNGKVTVSSIPIGGGAVTARKLYRTVAAGSDYLLVGTIADNSTTSYTDNIADASLGAGAPAVNTTEDPVLVGMLAAARESVEEYLQRALITRTLRYTIDRFPSCDILPLPRPNLLTVTSVQYIDTNGDTQTMSSSDYTVDVATLPGRIVLDWDASWPSPRDQRNAVIVNYTAGYGASRSAIPSPIKAAIKMMIGDLFEHREGEDSSADTIQALLGPYRFLEAA